MLASGSADKTVMLWDMSNQVVATTLNHPEKVQSLQFHPFEIQTLLTGCCDAGVRVYDCRSESSKSWMLEGEVERVLWDHFNPFCFLASTEVGHVYYVDVRNDEKPLWQLNAHSKACTGLALSSQCPGCLVTSSQDKTFKVWDIQSEKPSYITEHDFKLGNIYVTAACPDAPFAFCIGGDDKSSNFKVWDIRQAAAGTYISFLLSSKHPVLLDVSNLLLSACEIALQCSTDSSGASSCNHFSKQPPINPLEQELLQVQHQRNQSSS